MSRMTENQRMQFERPDLSERRTGVQVRSSRPLVIYMIVATVIAAALGYAAIEALDGWAMAGDYRRAV